MPSLQICTLHCVRYMLQCKGAHNMNDVYLVTNKVNGKKYVGITCKGYLARWKEHLSNSAAGSKSILHNAIRKYGPDNFEVSLLESNIADQDIQNKEKEYIRRYDTFYTSGHGYNMTEGGGGVAGYKHTSNTKRKISKSLHSHIFSESRNQKISAALKGYPRSDDWRSAISKSRLGKYSKDENPFYGKHHSDSTKLIISDANTKHAVLQLDPSTKQLIQVFKNCTAAGRWVVENGYSHADVLTCGGRIGEVCRNGNINCTAYEFSWKFEERSID